jgi:hypothetical protein
MQQHALVFRFPLVLLLLMPLAAHGQDATAQLQSQAMRLYGSLDAKQREAAVLPADDPRRDEEQFTGGPRAGLQLRQLSPQQRDMAMDLIKAFASDYGAQKCQAIAAQDGEGLDKYYLCFFGEPGEARSYAWRVAEHHLTLVHVEVEDGHPTRFGPILLGADPPVLWGEDEDLMISLFTALSPEERQRVVQRGRGISSAPLKPGLGMAIGELSPDAQQRAREVFESRMRFFAPAIQQRIGEVLDRQGGLADMRIVFFGEADKRAADGGRWDFKLGGDDFLCDYENTRGHIHLSMKGKLRDDQTDKGRTQE